MAKAKPPRHPGGRPRKERPDSMEGRVGEQIEAARKARGMTAQELASAAGLGTGSIIRLEAGGASPTLATTRAIANALGLSGEQLLKKVPDWTEKPPGK